MTDPIKRGGGAGPIDPNAAEGSAGTSGPRTEGFRETLGAEQATGAGESHAAQASSSVGELNQLASELREGRMSPEQVIEALVARQLRSHAAQMLAPAQRAELETLLRSRLSDDPTLLALGRDLSRGR